MYLIARESMQPSLLSSEGKAHGRGAQILAVDGQPIGSQHAGDAGDKYDGKWKDNQRHGACTYTFFNGETFNCTWADGGCPKPAQLSHSHGILCTCPLRQLALP